jgi:hypothetical protein
MGAGALDGRGVGTGALGMNQTTLMGKSMRMGLMTLIVALVVTLMATVVTEVDSDTDAFPVALVTEPASSAAPVPTASAPPPHCALQYAAVLDLAELHRSNGATSDAYRSALGKVSAKLNDCTPDEHHADLQS